MPVDVKKIVHFPTAPGVYLMMGPQKRVLYIGKAKNLKTRVKQYFLPHGDSRPMIPLLTAQITSIDYIIVSSEKEALLLENTLIKKHKPKYNALLKDDKTYFSLAINHKHRWPMVRIVRYKGKPPPNAIYFGPFTKGYAARQTLELLRSLFPLRQCSDRELQSRLRPCILYEMKKCIAPCVSKCTKEEYAALVKQVIEFLRGHDARIIKELQRQMQEAANALDFEKAEALLQTLRHIEITIETQRVEKAGMEDFDALGLYREADRASLAQMLYREGKLTASYNHFFSSIAEEDTELLSSFLMQHYSEKQLRPKEILLPLPLPDSSSLSALLSMTLFAPERGNKRALIKMAEKNAAAHFKQEKEAVDSKEQLLISLEEALLLTNFPERIECFDNSNLGGTEPVSAMVVYTHGEKDPKHYRKYKIKEADPSDDYGALKEVLTRRYRKAKESNTLPELLIIDGGRGHLNLACQVLSHLDISTVDIIAVAKEAYKHTKGITLEQVFLPNQEKTLTFKPHSPILFFLQQVRDEAHRFALAFQKERRKKRFFASALDTLPGIGPIKKERLLRHFGSLKKILSATPEELLSVKGITKQDLIRLKEATENFCKRD